MTRLNPIRLNLGCGNDRRDGYINVDILGGDLQVDLRKFPWPWMDNYADEVLMINVLEHMPDTQAAVEEVRRVLKPGGRFVGRVPHCRSNMADAHYQHFQRFHEAMFPTIAGDLGLTLTRVELVTDSVNSRQKIRNLIPGKIRKVLCELGVHNMWEAIEFEFVKP
jgi:SAM-dependent methyltransferase